mmetsp:Transcript_21735/g.70292  ORF Transcript_21735/g.70292 Transcript_21735/m.70292 type:complete len:445 (+) Transcript_21735:65-1399(+)
MAVAAGWAAVVLLSIVCAAGSEVGSYSLVLSRSCDPTDNGVYEYGGLTASGAPWFEQVGASRWIYHDPDCNDNGSRPEWTIDRENPPSTTALKDLDGDRQCRAGGFCISASSIGGPPTSATWQLWCNSTWKATKVSLEVQATTSTPTTVTATTTATPTTITTTTPTTVSWAAWLAVAISIVVFCALLGWGCWRLCKWNRKDIAHPQTSDRSLDPAWAAVTLGQLNDLRDLAKAELGLDYATATMNDVNRRILQPICAKHHKSYAQVVNGSEFKRAEIFVSHAWAENFDEFVTAVNTPFATWPVKPTLWICALALVQSTDPELVAIQVGVGDDPSDAPFTKALKKVDRILVVRNRQVDIYGRIWCCWEMFIAYQMGLVQKPGGLMVAGRPADTVMHQVVDISIAQASSLEDKRKILLHIMSQRQSFESFNCIVAEVRQFVADAVA